MVGDAPLPSGVVTFVFSDIEGSTRLMRRLGDRYDDVLQRHRAIFRGAWIRHGGREVSVEGDGCFVAFADTQAAVTACGDAQKLLGEEPWPAEGPVRVRMGVHSGLASPKDDDYVALAVHQAARVVAAAHGGQVIVSEQAAERAGDPSPLSLVSLGRFRLRDFDEAVRLCSLAGEGIAPSFPAVRAVPADGHNLVKSPTSFVGREQVVHDLRSRLAPGKLVTLVGPGGVGKTRLAIEIGVTVAPEWTEGVWLVELHDLGEGSLVTSTIASAVGAPTGGHIDGRVALIEHLRTRNALLILDNCEHVAADCAAVAQAVLAACPRIGVLATSREPLGVPGELRSRIDPLDVRGADAFTWPPAVELFVERARAARPDLVVDEPTAGAIAAICQRLDGLPLAIELAAARVTVQTPAEILDGLQNLSGLRTSDRTRVDRHRTMEALLDWSYRLLEHEEQLALRRLSLFGTSFTIAAATRAIASGDVPPDEVPELVWSLVDKSLVVADLSANATRYRLLETVRAFGRRHLSTEGEVDGVAGALASWALDTMGPWRRLDLDWMDAVGVELDNLRTLVGLREDRDVEVAEQLACTIGRYHDASDAFREGADELERFCADLSAPTTSRVALLTTLADLILRTGQTDRAGEVIDDAEHLRDALGSVPTWDDAGVDRVRGDLSIRLGDPAGAAETARVALERGLSPRGRSRMWNLLGLAATAIGDLEEAARAFREELALSQERGDDAYIASAYGNLAEAALRMDDLPSAALHQQMSLSLGVQLGLPVTVAFSLIVAARMEARARRWASATRLHARADAELEETGIVLFDDDRRVSETMLTQARDELGADTFAKEYGEGRALALYEAADLAVEIFESVRGARGVQSG